jgi:hypothetical protein
MVVATPLQVATELNVTQRKLQSAIDRNVELSGAHGLPGVV